MMYLRYGGPSNPFWYLQSIVTFIAYYRTDIGQTFPTNSGNVYTVLQLGAEPAGYMLLECPSSSSTQDLSTSSSTSSVIAVSTSSSSNSSTSSTWIPPHGYVSDCYNMESITSPLDGDTLGMTLSGHFIPTGIPPATDYDNVKDMHVLKSGLSKTVASRGVIFCKDASKLFTCGKGKVLLMLSLPYDVSNGVYGPVASNKGKALSDIVIWAVNIGQNYITPPGMYAAFTPDGIEFTIWTSAGKRTILANTSDASFQSGTDFVLEFGWDIDSFYYVNTIELYGNSVLLASTGGSIADDPLHNLYRIGKDPSASSESASLSSSSSSGSGLPGVSANFYLMDSPSGKNGLVGTVRRIEIRQLPRDLPAGFTGGKIKLAKTGTHKRGMSEFQFSIEGIDGHSVVLADPEFGVAVPVTADMQATGPVGSARQQIGEDAGAENKGIIVPEIPDDLPIGFDEIKEKS